MVSGLQLHLKKIHTDVISSRFGTRHFRERYCQPRRSDSLDGDAAPVLTQSLFGSQSGGRSGEKDN